MNKEDIVNTLREEILQHKRKIAALELSIDAVNGTPLSLSPSECEECLVGFVHTQLSPDRLQSLQRRIASRKPSSFGTLAAFASGPPKDPFPKKTESPKKDPKRPKTKPEPAGDEFPDLAEDDLQDSADVDRKPSAHPHPAPYPKHTKQQPQRTRKKGRKSCSKEDLIIFVRKGGSGGRTIFEMCNEFGLSQSGMNGHAHRMVQRGILSLQRKGPLLRFFPAVSDKQISLISEVA